MKRPRELAPLDVLIDLLGGADFDHEILDPEAAAKLIVERLADAGFSVVAAESMLTTPGPDATLFEAIAEWRSLWSASEALPDFDPRGAELRRQAYDIEWDVSAMAPVTMAGYVAKRDAIRQFELDHEDSIEILWQLAHDAGRLGVDHEMPNIRSPR